MDEEFDVDARWPELFAPLDETRRDAVRRALVAAWHEGWEPEREDVENLTAFAGGAIDEEEYLRRLRETVRRATSSAEFEDTAWDEGDGAEGSEEGGANRSAAPVAFDSWESYFYPPPHNATMRNVEGYTNPRALRMFEFGAATSRHVWLALDPTVVSHSHTFDAAYLRGIHRFLFQDVYPWAGEYRTLNMVKAGSTRGFADVEIGEVDDQLDEMSLIIHSTAWACLDRFEFATAAAAVFTHLNYAHPFREGNGRASKVFMDHVADMSRFMLDFSRINPWLWNGASALGCPEIGSYEVDPTVLEPVFREATVFRSSP
ncbi:MAG: Fic family protein [Propionibacteriaceae bacterium]|jgi:cell filamentation protein|nr:Fic family protein [Propionibacteriaceae bacterium]